ncbi:MAG: NAD(P)/FAD-dependent oxidoreductase, partial [Clostridia bacterium]|nr:NAD(P)/FAD-dependent oxidoreductase [Clostridia bacterium]
LRVQRDFAEFSNKQFSNSLDNLLPRSLISVILKKSKIPLDTKVHQITSEQRHSLVKLLKNLQFNLLGLEDITYAIITSGGVDVKQIIPNTMKSKIVDNLYFAGEIIDVDALTGGFNLQIAFSTGYLAGMSCAEE